MEDAATAEISRAQIWQWINHNAKTVDGKEITIQYYKKLFEEEIQNIKNIVGEEKYNKGKYKEASKMFNEMSTSKNFEEFLTLPSYELL